jgi:signal transduction protein with GAF and PtsI domain
MDDRADADRALVDAYVLMLDSPEIMDSVVQRIHLGNRASGALRMTIETHAQRFDLMDDITEQDQERVLSPGYYVLNGDERSL